MAKSRSSTSANPQAKPRADAYVGLLFIALLAQIAGAAFLFLDFSQYYPETNPAQKVRQAIEASKVSRGGAPVAPPPPGGGDKGAQVGGQMGGPVPPPMPK